MNGIKWEMLKQIGERCMYCPVFVMFKGFALFLFFLPQFLWTMGVFVLVGAEHVGGLAEWCCVCA